MEFYVARIECMAFDEKLVRIVINCNRQMWLLL